MITSTARRPPSHSTSISAMSATDLILPTPMIGTRPSTVRFSLVASERGSTSAPSKPVSIRRSRVSPPAVRTLSHASRRALTLPSSRAIAPQVIGRVRPDAQEVEKLIRQFPPASSQGGQAGLPEEVSFRFRLNGNELALVFGLQDCFQALVIEALAVLRQVVSCL